MIGGAAQSDLARITSSRKSALSERSPNLTKMSRTKARQLSHFPLSSRSQPCYQCLLLYTISAAKSNYSPKAFVAVSEDAFLTRLRKLFAFFLLTAELSCSETHLEAQNHLFCCHRRPIERSTANYHGQSQLQASQTQATVLLQSQSIRSRPETSNYVSTTARAREEL
jgi:hypothetical protein